MRSIAGYDDTTWETVVTCRRALLSGGGANKTDIKRTLGLWQQYIEALEAVAANQTTNPQGRGAATEILDEIALLARPHLHASTRTILELAQYDDPDFCRAAQRSLQAAARVLLSQEGL